jgi:hypothetical protein
VSNEAMTLCWKAADAPTDPGPMFVLIILADHGGDHSGEDFKAFPSVERIMERSKYKRSAVEAHLKALVNLGWISRRRRVRPDGRKGVYDYELHRDEGFRARLRAGRAALVSAGLKPTGEAVDAQPPCADSTHGADDPPCSDSGAAMREIHAEPCVKSAHHEPSVNPQITPTPRARDADRLVEALRQIEAAYPPKGIGVSNTHAALAALARLAEEGVDIAALPAAAAAYAADPLLAKRDYGPVRLERWLGEGRYRGWLATGPVDAPRQARFPAAALRAALVRRCGEAAVASYLDPCSWDETRRMVTPRTGAARRWLDERLRGLPEADGVSVSTPGGGAPSGGSKGDRSEDRSAAAGG